MTQIDHNITSEDFDREFDLENAMIVVPRKGEDE